MPTPADAYLALPTWGRALATMVVASGLAELLVVQPARFYLAVLAVPVTDIVAVLRMLLWVFCGVLACGVLLWPAESPRPFPEDRLRRRQGWLWSVLDEFSEGVVAFDASGRVAFANAAASELLRKPSLPEGAPMVAFSDVPRLRTAVAKALREGVQSTVELAVDGPPARTLMAVAAPIDGNAILLMLDVTERRAAIAGRETFLSDAAHELRTPIAGVRMAAEALEMGALADPQRAGRLVEGLSRQSLRLQALVDDLLSLFRLESGGAALDIEPLELEPIVQEVVDALADPRIEVRGEPLDVLADRLALERVLLNLVQNALRYADGPVVVRWARTRQRVRIEVKDTGPGIPDAHKDKVFERFHRVDVGRSRKLGGTGLGLAIVKQLVQRNHGTIHAEDNTPTGARFVVDLPAAPES